MTPAAFVFAAILAGMAAALLVKLRAERQRWIRTGAQLRRLGAQAPHELAASIAGARRRLDRHELALELLLESVCSCPVSSDAWPVGIVDAAPWDHALSCELWRAKPGELVRGNDRTA